MLKIFVTNDVYIYKTETKHPRGCANQDIVTHYNCHLWYYLDEI